MNQMLTIQPNLSNSNNQTFLQRKRNPDESINFFDKSIFFNEKINGNEFDAQLETNKIDTNSNSKDSIINGSTLIEKENKIENHKFRRYE